MIERILRYFPPHTHPLALASDPDGVLTEEAIATALAERGFALINESDLVRLRYQVEQRKPFTVDHSLIVVTQGQLEGLPYDLWEQGHHVHLELHRFFPYLVYPVVRSLTPAQRRRLSETPPPQRPLGRQATEEHVLRAVFGAALAAVREPAGLIAWLNRYHQDADPLPALLTERLPDGRWRIC